MKSPNLNPKCILITHVVNPHQFYFKYTNNSVNSEFSKLDFEIQLYGNELHLQKTYDNGYLPAENEMVIFFNVIFNKWIRGRVVNIGEEITLWCIDSGIPEKCAAQHVLPLTPRFHEDLKLVHLGGLSLLPTDKTLNIQTVEVEIHLAKQWDPKTTSYFKGIVNSSKTITFTEEFELSNHKFGSLTVESKTAQNKGINNILLEMNNVAHSYEYPDEDLRFYVCKDQIEKQLYQSLNNGSTMPAALRNLSNKIGFGSTMSSIDGDFYDSCGRQSSDATMLEIETKSSGSSTTHRYENPKAIVSNSSPIRSEAPLCVSGLDAGSCDNLDGSVNAAVSSTTTTANTSASSSSSLSQKPNGANCTNDYECFLRTCQSNIPKGLRQPLESTKNFINSLHKSTSTSASRGNIFLRDRPYARSNAKVDEIRRTRPLSATSSATTSRRKMLAATLAKKESTTESTNIIVNSSKNSIKHFGVPAGYAKNCLDTFGGMNIE